MKVIDKYRIMLVIIVTSLITVFFIIIIFKNLKNLEGNPNDIAYTGKSAHHIGYDVYIKDNPFIEENILTANHSFITSLIEKITLNYEYNLKFDQEIDIIYNYLIKANIVGLYNSDGSERVMNPIWNKEYVLLKQTEDMETNNNISISQSLDISLLSYNDLVASFINDFNIPLNSTLEIKLVINFKGNIKNHQIQNEHFLLASIPLGVKAFDITTSNNFKEEEKVYLNPIPKKETIYVKTIIYIIINLILVGSSYYYIKQVIDKYRSKYLKEKNQILKDFDERIVEVTNFVKYEKWENVDVTTFEELLNLSNEAFEPIFFWERKVHHNREAWFCILRDKVLYRYIIYKNDYVINSKT